MLQGSMDCPLLIAPSVIYNFYYMCRAAFFLYVCAHLQVILTVFTHSVHIHICIKFATTVDEIWKSYV